MVRLYAVSIIINFLAGSVLSYDFLDSKFGIGRVLNRAALENGQFRLILGGAAFVVGFLKFIFVFPGDLAIVGDLAPALAGICAGLTLLAEQLGRREEVSSAIVTLNKLLVGNAQWIGLVTLLVAAVHLVVPNVVFL
jgi:hypothetical protein